jgi:hypothetical protein
MGCERSELESVVLIEICTVRNINFAYIKPLRRPNDENSP